MKHYYATGNGGNGTQVYAFNTLAERDNFVAWNTNFDQRSKVNKDQVRKYHTRAILLIAGQMVPDGYGPTTINL